MSQEEKAKMVLDDLADRLPEQYEMEDIRGRVDEVTPYVMVAIQVRQCGCVDKLGIGCAVARHVDLKRLHNSGFSTVQLSSCTEFSWRCASHLLGCCLAC